MKAKVIETGEIIEVKEWRGASDVIYSTLDMNKFFQESELELLLDATEKVIKSNSKESVLIPSPHLRMPGRMLFADELANLREIANFLSSQYDLISPIGDEYEERLEAVEKQHHCTKFSDAMDSHSHIPVEVLEAISGFRDISDEDCLYSNSLSKNETHGDMSQDTFASRGRSGDNPIDAITWDLKELIHKIRTLCDTGILQTTSALSVDQITLHQSSDGSIHAQIHIPI